MKKGVLIIGAGGVAHVVAHKCAQNNKLLGAIHIASRRREKCEAIIHSIQEKSNLQSPGILEAHTIDAMDVEATAMLIRETGVGIVINVGSAFLNKSILKACIETGAAYIDTAIHEDKDKVCEAPPWYANHEWKMAPECEEKKITAILGAGFDPGVVNAYAAYAYRYLFDSITEIDILDVNAGSHGRYFATNFDPEINFREFTGRVWSWQNSQWKSDEMFSVSRSYDFPEVGEHKLYMTGHDEIHSLSKNLNVPNIRFWMGFGDHYINVFTVLKNIGLLSEHPVSLPDGREVVPLQMMKAVLPDPASLAPTYTGRTCIGNHIKGVKDGEAKEVFIYNLCDHAENYEEVGSQAISYTAGVPAVAAAILVANGAWNVHKMVNVEELPPIPFLALIEKMGLPTRIRDKHGDRSLLTDDIPASEPLRKRA